MSLQKAYCCVPGKESIGKLKRFLNRSRAVQRTESFNDQSCSTLI